MRTRGPRGAEPKEQERERPNGRVQEAGTRVQVGTSHDEDSVSESKLYPVEEFMQTFVRQEAVMWQKGGLLSIAGDNLLLFCLSPLRFGLRGHRVGYGKCSLDFRLHVVLSIEAFESRGQGD